MKNVCATFFVLFYCATYAQAIAVQAVIKDAVTKEAIGSASVGIKDSPKGTITNEEGAFQLTAPKNGIIQISYLGYKLLAIPASEFTSETKTILLEQNDEILEEVMVTKMPLYQILRDVVSVSRARFNKPILLHTYYREFVKSNNRYTKFSDGLLDYHISGTTKKTKSDLSIQQNRSVLLGSDEDEDETTSFLNVQRGIANGYDLSHLSENILSEKQYGNYDFELKSKKDKTGNERFAISFEPKSAVEKALYQGTITYDPITKLIYEIDISMAPSHQQYASTTNLWIAKFSVLDSKYKASYKMVNSNYIMYYNNRYFKMRIWTKKLDYTDESRSDLIVTDFEKDDLKYTKKDLYTKKHLYDKPSQFTDKFWQKNNAIVLTNEEQKIINSLENRAAETPKKQ